MYQIVRHWVPTSLVLSALTLALTLFVFNRQQSETKTKSISKHTVQSLIQKFQNKHSKLEGIELPIAWEKKFPAELVDPLKLFPDLNYPARDTFSKLLAESENCETKVFDAKKWQHSQKDFQKLLHWFRYKCKSIALPETVWRSPPLVHPFGGSWAHWLFRKGFDNKIWLQRQREFLHVLEYSDILDDQTDFTTRVLASFKPMEFQKLVDGRALALTESYLLIPTYYDFEKAHFHVYDSKSWSKFLESNSIQMSATVDQSCTVIDNNFCWKYIESSNWFLRSESLPIILIVLILFLTSYFLLVLWLRSREEAKLREQQQLVMQTLAHELRHPVTGLRLSIESIRPFYDSLPEQVETEFLRLANTSQRMSRIVQFSQSYLQLLMRDGQFIFRKDTIPNFGEFLEATLEEYEEKIQFEHFPNAATCEIDSYWVGTCIKNLVINALTYGAPPIIVGWSKSENDLYVSVKDHGDSTKLNYKELIKPQIKRSGTGGLGLGLSLVYRVVNLMGGELSLDKSPTCFKIKLKGVFLG